MNENDRITIHPLGDAALVVKLSNEASPNIHKKIIHLLHILESEPFPGLIEVVPTYTNITVFYDPIQVISEADTTYSSYETVHKMMLNYMGKMERTVTMEQRTVQIPVLYGGMYGPDLVHVAQINGMTEQEVIQIHSAQKYLVYMIGFAPGFPFLGGMDERIAAPRKDTPRPTIPAGSVGIAGTQTGVYPIDTPGGWQIIGQTPRNLFLRNEEIPSLLASGDILQFVPITEEQFKQYEAEEGGGRWQLK